jgi:hypothetical protein
MIIRKRYVWMLTLIILAMILSACNGAAATEDPAAAIDPNQIYTQAAETVSAQLTAAAPAEAAATEPAPAALPPTYTPIPDQAAALPTFTLAVPTVDPGGAGGAAAPDPNQIVLPQQPAAAVPTAVPTKAAGGADKLEDMARFLYQYPGDGFQFNPGSKFDATFTFENIGDTTWNTLYSIRRYQGETFGLGSSKFTFDDHADNQTVEKGGVVNITINGLQAPLSSGAHDSFWCLYNNREDQGKSPQCFYLFYINIIVN